jgi:serine/threonine protein phosphatase PrpC
MPLKVTVGTVTDRGLNPKRASNEDRLLALPQARLFLVADGVGGRRGGQVASQTVVDVFKQAC